MRSLRPPASGTPSVLPPGAARRVAVLAADADELGSVARALGALRENGHTVVLVWRDGEPGRRLRSFMARRQVTGSALPRSPRSLVGALRDGSLRERVAGRGTLLGDVRADPAARAELERADAVLLVGESAGDAALADALTAAGTPLVPADELAWWADLGRTWRTLDELVAAAGGEGLAAEEAGWLAERVRLLGGRVDPARQEVLATVVAGLHPRGEYAAALGLADHLRWEVGPQASADPGAVAAAARRRGLAALVRTSATGREAPDLRSAVGALLRVADAGLEKVPGDQAEGDDLVPVVEATTLALELLFHRELHADGLTSPLVEDPDAFLADWRTSRVGALLGSKTPAHPAVRQQRDGHGPASTRGRARVVVSPGTFPKFAGPVVEALAERADVHELDLSSRVDLRWLGVSSTLVERRLRHALGLPTDLDLELIERLETADALLVDWADRAAVELVMSVPAGRRVTVRIHSMDALSAWVHLVDWSRVDDLVLVSEHLRLVVTRILGERLRHTRLHVVPNVVDLSRLTPNKQGDHRRRLLMTGWAQRVKDPLWALEILAALRSDDPRWRLTLLGADFLLNQVTTTQDYAVQFWHRLVQDDVRDAVDLVGFTNDVGPVLAGAGFVLSTSRRESFGLGLVEGAVSGCVPVVRDWPIFAAVGGARGLFPTDWVVDTVEEAVERIRATCDEPSWTQASEVARMEGLRRFATDTSRARLRAIVLGGA